MNSLNYEIINYIKKNTEVINVKTFDDFESFYHVIEDNTSNTHEICLIENYLNKYKNINNILDIGSAGGRLAIPLIKNGHNLCCIDKSKYQCDRIINKLEIEKLNARIINEDILSYSFEENLFDICIMLNSVSMYFNSMIDMSVILAKVRECLKKDGIFIFDIVLSSEEKRVTTFFNNYYDENDKSLIIREVTIQDNCNYNDCTVYTFRFNDKKYDMFREYNREMKYNLSEVTRLINEHKLEILDIINYDDFCSIKGIKNNKDIDNVIIVCKKR